MLYVGFLTIGQSPRVDVMEDASKILSRKIKVIEAGALDDFTKEDIERKLKPEPGHTIYVTRLRNGAMVKISKEKILSLMQEKIREIEGKVDIIAILCSGEFPEFESKVPIIYPDKLLKSFIQGISFKGTLGVLIPISEQLDYARRKWGSYAKSLVVKNISPYTARENDFRIVAWELAKQTPTLIIMDCIGYSLKHKSIVREVTNTPVISTRGVVFRFLNELAE